MSKKLKCRARKFGVKTELADQKLALQNWPDKNWRMPNLAQQKLARPKTGAIPKLGQS